MNWEYSLLDSVWLVSLPVNIVLSPAVRKHNGRTWWAVNIELTPLASPCCCWCQREMFRRALVKPRFISQDNTHRVSVHSSLLPATLAKCHCVNSEHDQAKGEMWQCRSEKAEEMRIRLHGLMEWQTPKSHETRLAISRKWQNYCKVFARVPVRLCAAVPYAIVNSRAPAAAATFSAPLLHRESGSNQGTDPVTSRSVSPARFAVRTRTIFTHAHIRSGSDSSWVVCLNLRQVCVFYTEYIKTKQLLFYR